MFDIGFYIIEIPDFGVNGTIIRLEDLQELESLNVHPGTTKNGVCKDASRQGKKELKGS